MKSSYLTLVSLDEESFPELTISTCSSCVKEIKITKARQPQHAVNNSRINQSKNEQREETPRLRAKGSFIWKNPQGSWTEINWSNHQQDFLITSSVTKGLSSRCTIKLEPTLWSEDGVVSRNELRLHGFTCMPFNHWIIVRLGINIANHSPGRISCSLAKEWRMCDR